MLSKSFTRFLVFIILSLSASWIFAQVPQLINYQGVLTDESGNPVNGDRLMRFCIYTSATRDSALWTETQTVPITEGLFSVLLGSVNPLPYSVFNEEERYFSLKIGTDPEMTPKKRLVSVGYSFHANHADSLGEYDASSFVRHGEVDAISTDMVQDDAVTEEKIGPDIVSSISGVTNNGGNIELEAGSNVTITPDDANNRITISSAGGGVGGDITAVTAGIGLSGGGASGAVTLNVDVPLQLSSSTSEVIKGTCGSNYGYLGGIGTGVHGNGSSIGVHGFSSSGQGVYGYSSSNYGVYGKSTSSYGVYGKNGVNYGYLGSSSYGVYGMVGSNYGYLGSNTFGAYGKNGDTYGYLGSGGYGVYGRNSSSGSYGYLGSLEEGVFGYGNSFGVYGKSGSNYGYLGSSIYGVYGSGIYGVYGSGTQGVKGYFDGDHWGYIGSSSKGAYFKGDVGIVGTISKTAGSFKIDHPLDPANKYLQHSFVESPDMKNVYDGVIVLDSDGKATVDLADWFETLNQDFRYQLTAVGGPEPNLYIAEEIVHNHFTIAGGVPGMKVSWQVTGIRQDAYAKAHRIQVEVEKTGNEQGKYLHPKELGMPENMSMDYEEVQRMQSNNLVR